MKLICDGLDLSDAVLKVSKALSVKNANPILEGIKIKACGETLTLSATDTEISIEKTIKADIMMEGETVVVGKYFVDFTKKLEKEQVELSRLYDAGLQIKYSDSFSELQVFPAESFPIIEKLTDSEYFEISQKDFKSIVEKTVFACSTDDSRPILKGCLFEIIDNNLTVVALDGFRMCVCKKEVNASGNVKAIIPARTLNEIVRLLDSDQETLKVYIQKNSLSIEVNNTLFVSRLIEGEFVKYNHILPNSFENTVVVNKNALLSSLERATIVARNDRYNVIKLDIKEDIMGISAKSEIGNVNENVGIDLKGKDLTIAFNGKYIMDYLKIIEDDFIKINLNTQIDPCVINTLSNGDFLYLLLPIRISA